MFDKDRLDITPDQGKQYKTWTCNKLASYFSVPKATLIADVDFREPLIYSPLLYDAFQFKTRFHSVHIPRPKDWSLSYLMSGKKIMKSYLYEWFVMGEDHTNDVDTYAMAIHITNHKSNSADIYVMYRTEAYEGIGGIFVKTSDEMGLVLEPINHWLQHRYPKPEPELD